MVASNAAAFVLYLVYALLSITPGTLFGNKRLRPRDKIRTLSSKYGGCVEIFEKCDSQPKCVAEQGP